MSASLTSAQLFGLQELYRPYRSEPTVDIVAVHGLNGDRNRTWTAETESSRLCWLNDPEFLPHFLPTARVLTFGYNANVWSGATRAASSERLLHHAQTLIAQLYTSRDLDGALARPIIFVCHSLGGIVVKKALTYAESQFSIHVAHLRSIYLCTFALLFLGTPHHGSSKALLAHSVAKLASRTIPNSSVSFSTTLLKTLELESEALQDVTIAFVPIMPRFRIFFFWEQHKTDLHYTRDFVVEESSAAPIIDNTERCGIAADHREMCRFSRPDDPGHLTICAALRRYTQDAPTIIYQRLDEAASTANNAVAVTRETLTLPMSVERVSPKRKSLVIKPAWQIE